MVDSCIGKTDVQVGMCPGDICPSDICQGDWVLLQLEFKISDMPDPKLGSCYNLNLKYFDYV